MARKTLALVLPFLLLPLTASAPDAGGWGVITVENLPEHLVAGTPVELTYTVRQHGVTLRAGLTGSVTASSGGEVVRAQARAGEREGEYRAELTVPEAGRWTLTVQSEVIPGTPITAKSRLLPLEAVRPGEAPRTVSHAEQGLRLYVAKGCVTCHTHRAAADVPSLGVAPELTGKHYPADYLGAFLADPSIRPTESVFPMPDLGLDDTEIVSLVAFINAEEDTWVALRGGR